MALGWDGAREEDPTGPSGEGGLPLGIFATLGVGVNQYGVKELLGKSKPAAEVMHPCCFVGGCHALSPQEGVSPPPKMWQAEDVHAPLLVGVSSKDWVNS